MSSDASPRIAAVRHYLGEHLKPMLPEAWSLVDHLTAVEDLDIPELHLEFTEITNQQDGQAMAPGLTICSVDLLIIVPTGDAGPRAEDEVDQALDALVIALDDSPVTWGPTCTKQRFEPGGQYGWRVPLRILTNSTTDPDPAP